MIAFTHLCLLVAAAVGVNAASRQDSNRFIDDLLSVRLPSVPGINAVALDDFKFKIKKELELGVLPTHRDIKANFTNGVLNGLGNLRRRDNCEPTVGIASGILLSCPIDLSSLEAKYTSFVKGFNIVGQVKEISVTVKILSSFINFEVQQDSSQQPFVKTFLVDRILTKIEMPDIGFNEERQTKFKSEVDKAVQPILINVLSGKLLDSINVALKGGDLRLPPV
ncbi:uncharacterized protein LOC100901300 [Galendromus occidentalis]|uniref:Uncharacterized protein LOC100901300 n=1 Tax=Galendromus occidentalis TaxID=34638 RepID=A0AAJ6VXK3_9ACAR|nr:uncharacterized protein LOC100901300 [Galendromus occidentalis]